MSAMPQPSPEKLGLLESYLEKVAEELGDITPLVLGRFYQQYPDAKELFEYHGRDDVAHLESSMVDQSLYCVMTWFERPLEIHIILSDTVPHHEVLKIPTKIFQGFFRSVIEVLLSAQQEDSGAALIEEIQKELITIMEAAE